MSRFFNKKAIIRRWTQQAIECYTIGCRCSQCEMNELMKGKCQMKHVVLELVRVLGRPKGNDYDTNNTRAD